MLQNNYENQKTQYKIIKNAKRNRYTNEQTSNCILNPCNLLTRGLRLTTKLIYRRVLINEERKTDIKKRRQRDAETQKLSSSLQENTLYEIDIIMKN